MGMPKCAYKDIVSQVVVVHAFNLSTQEAEARQIFVSSRLGTDTNPVWKRHCFLAGLGRIFFFSPMSSKIPGALGRMEGVSGMNAAR